MRRVVFLAGTLLLGCAGSTSEAASGSRDQADAVETGTRTSSGSTSRRWPLSPRHPQRVTFLCEAP